MLSEADGGKPQAVIIATGSEVELAVEAQKLLAAKGIAGARGVDAVDQRLRRARTPPTRESVLPQGRDRASRSRPASPTAGTSTSAWTARWSASTASANPPRPARCSRNSASPPRTSPRRWKSVL
ncbi:MAG: hypothetical protein MZV65_12600 [Chromatiales bacterium]|nr:hypothetical protein [Chromatiales bacterium]